MECQTLIRTGLLLLAASACEGQGAATIASQQPTAKSVASSPITYVASEGDYVLGGGDEVTLRVMDMPEVPDKPLRVDPDGGIDLPLVGRVQASGLTLLAFRVELQRRYSKYVTDPQITVNLVGNASRTVSVIGEVNSPGVRQLPGPRTLIEVISLAGGVKPDAGSRVVLTRMRSRGPLPVTGVLSDSTGQFSTATLSLDDLLAAKNPANNILIQPGDVISIPKGAIVYVVGDVQRAGGFPLTSHVSLSLLQAISLAEGLGRDAASKNAKILRPVPGSDGRPREIPVNVKDIFAGKAPDLPLYADDILFIPSSAAKSGARRAADAIIQVATGVAIYAR